MQYQAQELHAVADGYERFCRVILYDNIVIVREGKVGTKGHRRVTRYARSTTANRNFHDLVADKCFLEDFQQILSDYQEPRFKELPSADQLEEAMFANWHSLSPVASQRALYEEGVEWMVVKGIFTMSRKSSLYRIMLADATLVQHAVDPARDIGLLPMWTGLYPNALARLGSVSIDHTSRVAEVALSLYYQGHPAPEKLFDAASTLAVAR